MRKIAPTELFCRNDDLKDEFRLAPNVKTDVSLPVFARQPETPSEVRNFGGVLWCMDRRRTKH